MSSPGDVSCEANERCITCGDVAVEMTVLRVDAARGLALCECDEGRESVEVALVGDVAEGDLLLVHAATAIAHLGSAPGLTDVRRGARQLGVVP